jgi:tetratricopeptide (TPR) repeat protein
MDRSRVVYVRVKPNNEPVESTKSSGGHAPLTSAAELRVPNDARKAFKKGLDAWQQNNFPKAAEYFEKATSIYPEYDTAYNNLGVMYAHQGELEKARAAFERSVQLNDKNADADRNLARLLLRDNQVPRAQELLQKSLVVEPLNPVSLTLLAVTEMAGGNFDAALDDARKAHSVPHDGYALSHYLAGQVLERKQQYQGATAEYQMYLRETPNGPEGAQVRSALERLSAAGTASRANEQ